MLSIIADSGPLVPADIRRLGTQDKSTISWAIKRLEERGFLSRQPRSHDARTFEVSLSDEGWKYYDHVGRSRRKAGACWASSPRPSATTPQTAPQAG